jgi:hypothetical protein
MREAVVAGASTHGVTGEFFDTVFPGLESWQIDLGTINGAEAHGEYSGLGYSQEVLGLGARAGHWRQRTGLRWAWSSTASRTSPMALSSAAFAHRQA